MQRMFHIYASLFVCTMLIFCSCAATHENIDQDETPFVITGVVQYLALSEGCWQFICNDETTYQLVGDNILTLLKDGLRIEIKVREVRNVRSNCSAGKTVELLEIIQTFDQ